MQTRQALKTDTSLCHVHLELGASVRLDNVGEQWHLASNGFNVRFRLPSGKISAFLTKLQAEGCALEELDDVADESGPLSVKGQVERLWRSGLVVQVLLNNGSKSAILHNFGETPLFPQAVTPADELIMTENACIHREGDSLMIEALDCGATLELVSPQLFHIPTAWMKLGTCSEVAERANVPIELATAVAAWLATIGAAEIPSHVVSDRNQLMGWSFADRLMHARSRMGRHVRGYGATFPLRGKIPEPAALKPACAGKTLELLTPDLDKISANEGSLTSILESRKSIREHGNNPPTHAELSEFLYRTARVKKRIRASEYEVATRPYPSGGALYELEFYPLVNRCEGIPPALYRYDAGLHCMEQISPLSAETRQLLADAMRSCGMRTEPHVLIVLAARFLRVNWKYESLAYALILKDVGTAYQTMYLVATAMGLAPCALGGGNSVTFCRAAGTQYWAESSVGEFLLGRAA
jgi:SagB-type dehydrogenase family enzyme